MIEFTHKQVKKIIIMIGLTDKHTLEQEYDEETVVRMINDICLKEELAYSVKFQYGAYINAEGKYVNERSIEIILIDQPLDKVTNVCKALRLAFHQECLMSTIEDVELHTVLEK